MTKRLDVVLHSDYPPETCLAKLAKNIDVDHWTIFSLSGYKGSGAVLGRIAGDEFRLHKRRYGHNSFGPVLFGRVTEDGRGSLIEGYWSLWPAVHIFMSAWFGLAALVGLPIFITSIQRAVNDRFAGHGDWWIGLVVTPGILLWGVFLWRFGAALSFHERGYIVEFLQGTLVAGQVPRLDQQKNWKSSFDRLWR